MKTRVLIADDHEVVRRGLKWMLRDADIEIIGDAGTSAEIIDIALREKPDVALVDVRLAEEDGLDLVDSLRTKLPSLRTVILSTYDNPTYLARAVALGCFDYLLKGAGREVILAAIRRAAKRELPDEASLLRSVKKNLALRHMDPTSGGR